MPGNRLQRTLGQLNKQEFKLRESPERGKKLKPWLSTTDKQN